MVLRCRSLALSCLIQVNTLCKTKHSNDIKEGHDNLEFTKHVSTQQASSSVTRLNKLKLYKDKNYIIMTMVIMTKKHR